MALRLLCEGAWWTLGELVRETALPRRTLEALLGELAPERSGPRLRLSPGQSAAYRAAVDHGHRPPADPVEHLLPEHAAVVERLQEMIAAGPRGRHALDHVSATPQTVVRRALLIGARFWPHDATVVCVGDHDLTSLAIAMLHPRASVLVADVDERILAHIDEQAARGGLDVRTRWADLRLGLPPSLHGVADLVVTDPPYTPDGVSLFVARGVTALRDPERGRVLLAYGASDRTPALALKVQRGLQDLNLVFEAVYPGFNRYDGAEAIGAAADLYVLRPTAKTAPAVAARSDRVAIYTKGAQAVEARRAPARPVLADFTPALLVGEWPADLLPRVPRARLATWLAKPYAAAPAEVAVVLPDGMEAALPRVLLATRADRVRVFTEAPPDDGLAGILSPVYALTATGGVIDAVRRPVPGGDDERVLRMILDSGHGKIANTWREALTRTAGLGKRQAREVIARLAPWAAGCTPLDLPAHRFPDLADAVRRSVREPT
jgi:branched-chain polyamine synthase A-like protein